MDFSANDVAFVSTIAGHFAQDEKNDKNCEPYFCILGQTFRLTDRHAFRALQLERRQ